MPRSGRIKKILNSLLPSGTAFLASTSGIKHMEQTIKEIFELTIKKMAEQATFNRNDYKEFIEESIEYYREHGRLTDDDNQELIEDELMERWPAAKKRLEDKTAE